MKWLILVESIQTEEGGPAQILAHIANGLIRTGDSITFACVRPVTKCVDLPSGVQVVHLARKRRNPIEWLSGSRVLAGLLRGHDAVIVGGIWGPYDGLALHWAQPWRKPVLIIVFGMLAPYILERGRWKKKLAWGAYTYGNLSNAKYVITHSRAEAEQVVGQRIARERVRVASIGLEIASVPRMTRLDARERLEWSPEDRVLIYLGRIHPKKGLDKLLIALKSAALKDSPWKLVIAGSFSDPAYEERIRALACEDDIKTQVSFVGLVCGEWKWMLLIASDLFVLPSCSEGFSMAVLESMAASTPVMITPGCNFPAVRMERIGYIIEPEPVSLSEALVRAYGAFSQLSEMGKKARRYVEDHHEFEAVAKQYRVLAHSTAIPATEEKSLGVLWTIVWTCVLCVLASVVYLGLRQSSLFGQVTWIPNELAYWADLFPRGRKLVGFAALGLLITALQAARKRSHLLCAGLLLPGAIELAQTWIPNRHGQISDALIGTVGVLLFPSLIFACKSWFALKRPIDRAPT